MKEIKKKKKRKFFRFGGSNPNAPKVLVSKDSRFIIYREALKNFPWKKLTFTFIIILLGGVGSAATQARIANTENEIVRAERELRSYRAGIAEMNSRLLERYTFVEIERIAAERLGMSFPDASQIINIYVPRVGGVMLNTADYALPQHNYFWHDIRTFFTGLMNRIFGG
jgi:cell division protein FtsL